MTTRKHYSSTFKTQMVQELLKEEKTLSQLASEYGIHPNVFGKWKRTALKALPGTFEENQRDEIARLKAEYERKQEQLYAEIGRLTTQVNFLKKIWFRPILKPSGGQWWNAKRRNCHFTYRLNCWR